MTRHSIIAALTHDRVIGKDNNLPWKLRDDLRLFKELTTGHAVVMGRNTFDSIALRLGKPLPNRLNVVVSNRLAETPGIEVARSLDEAFAVADRYSDETFVIGGEKIYSLALPRADRMYLSWVDEKYSGDAFFPKYDENEWSVVERKTFQGFLHIVYDRRCI